MLPLLNWAYYSNWSLTFESKGYILYHKRYIGDFMVTKQTYKKELYSLPTEVVEDLVTYAKETNQKKSHIVAEAIGEYVNKKEKEKFIAEALSIIGSAKGSIPDIQEIKANRYNDI
jgi:predicted DNA-binding protein